MLSKLLKNWRIVGFGLMLVTVMFFNVSTATACDAPPSSGDCSGDFHAQMNGPDDPKVCHKDRPDEWGCPAVKLAATVDISTAGYYSIEATSVFDSGDDQLNESYYLTVENSDGTMQYATDGNAGPYYVVDDAGGPASSENRAAGTYWFDEGVNQIYINHYSLIWDEYPDYKNEPVDPLTESVAVHALCLTYIPPIAPPSEPVISLDKQGPQYAEPGEEITYTLDWSVSEAGVTNLVLTDNLPEKTTFVSASGDYTKDGNVIAWNLGNKNAGDSGRLELVVVVDSYTYDTDIIVNTAKLDSNETEPVEDSVETEMDAHCITVINKIDNIDPVEPGGQITYTIEYENIGDGICVGTGVMLGEFFDERTSFVSSSPEDPHYYYGDMPEDPMPDGMGEADVLWQWPELLPDGPHFMEVTVVVDGQVEDGDVLTNEACIWSENGGKVCATEDTTVSVPPAPYYNVSINKSVDKSTAEPGDDLLYSLDWSVTGNSLAPEVTVSDILPAGVEFVSASDGGVYATSTHSVVWNLGDISPETSGIFNVNVTLEQGLAHGLELVNLASIKSGQEHDEDDATTIVNNPPVYDLQIEKTANTDEVYVGQEISYMLSWQVSGSGEATNVVIEDNLPEEVSFVSASDGGNYIAGMHKIVWSLGDVAAGTSGTFTVVAKAEIAPDGNETVNYAEIHSDGKSDNDTAAVSVFEVPYYEVNIEKSAPEFASPGEQINYQIFWGVEGNITVDHVHIIDTLPAGVTLTDAGGGHTSGNQIYWDFYNVEPTATGTLEVAVELDQTLANGDELTNEAEIIAGDKSDDDSATTIVSGAYWSVSIEKTADQESVLAGDNLVYTLDWQVAGNTVAPNVIITDTLPDEVNLVSATLGYSQSGQVLTWSLGDKNPGDSGRLEIVVKTISVPDNQTGEIENVAVIVSGDESDNDNVSTTIKDYDVAISKDGPEEASPFDEITYAIEWSVSGSGVAPEVTVEDTLPAGVTFVSASGDYSKLGNVVSWTFSDVAPGTVDTLFITVALNDVQAGDQVENFVEITSRDKSDSDYHSTAVVEAPYYALSVKKSANKEQVLVGDYLSYTIEWNVTGNTTAPNVIVADSLPDGVSLVSATTGYSQTGQTLTWELGDQAAGASGTLSVNVKVDSMPEGQSHLIKNLALITSGDESDSDNEETLVVDYDVDIEKTAPTEVNPGGDIVYTINWSVSGDVTAEDVVVTDDLPEGTTFLTATGDYTLVNNKIVWNLGDQEPGAAGSLGLAVSVDTGAELGDEIINNVSMVSGDRTDEDDAATLVVEGSYYTVGIEKVANQESVLVGDNLVYTINWQVAGNTSAPNVIITDSLPENVTLISASGDYATTSDSIIWQLGDISEGSSGSIEVTVRVDSMPADQSGQMVNAAVITSGPQEDSDQETTAVLDYSLDISKTAPEEANAGDQISYTVDWLVTGSGTAPEVVVADTLPAGTTFVSASGAYSIDNGVITWIYTDVAPGSGGTITLTVELSDVQPDEVILNHVDVDSRDKHADAEASTTVVEGEYFNLSLVKNAASEVKAGDNIVYELNWSVTGNATATDVVLADTLPAGVTFVSADGNYTYDDTTRTVSWNLGDVVPETEGSFEITVSTSESVSGGTVVTNNAILSSGDKSASDNVSTTVTKEVIITGCTNCGGGGFSPNPRVAIEYDYPWQKEVGFQYDETVTVKNTGNIVLTNGVLVVDFPEEYIRFMDSDTIPYTHDINAQKVRWSLPAIAVGSSLTVQFSIEAAQAGDNVVTAVAFKSTEADGDTSGEEDIVSGSTPPPLPPTPPVVPAAPAPAAPTTTPVVVKGVETPSIVVAPAATAAAQEVCQTCPVGQACEGCSWWLWLIVALVHILAMVVYWFFASKEEIKENEDGEYYIVKGSWGWLLPVSLALAIVYLLLVLVCHLAPWWAVLIILAAYLLALIFHSAMLKRAEMKYSPVLPVLVTAAALMVYLLCSSWPWWVWVSVLVFYALTLASYYLLIVKMDLKNRSYWWLVVLFMTVFIVGLEMVLRLCQCTEVIR